MNQIKIGLMGCGRVSSRHVDAICNKVPTARIAAVCDLNAQAAAKYSKSLGIPAFSSLREMCSGVELDVVAVATPSGYHFDHAMEALALGKHVIVEKPLALRLEHVDQLVGQAQRFNRLLWVSFQNRYNPAVIKACEAVGEGRLGKLVAGTVRVRWCRDQSYYDQDNWHGTWALDGGVVSQQAIHHIDALRWLMGEVESVEAQCSTRLVQMECEDLCVASLKFTSGALGVVEAMTAARPTDMEASLSLLGEKGNIVLGGIALNKIESWDFVDRRSDDDRVAELFSQEVPNAYGYGHDILYARVADSVLNAAAVQIPGEEGRKALEIVHAIYASAELGARVCLADRPMSSRLGLPRPADARQKG